MDFSKISDEELRKELEKTRLKRKSAFERTLKSKKIEIPNNIKNLPQDVIEVVMKKLMEEGLVK